MTIVEGDLRVERHGLMLPAAAAVQLAPAEIWPQDNLTSIRQCGPEIERFGHPSQLCKVVHKKPRDWRGFGSIPWHAKTKVRLRFIQTRVFGFVWVWMKENKCVFDKHSTKARVSCSWRRVPSATHLTVSTVHASLCFHDQRTRLGRKGPWRVPCQLKKPFKGTRQFSCCEEQQRIVFPWFAL